MTVLSVPAFGAGVVKEGSSDSQRTDELSACDSFDIGPRGHLIAASDVSAFAKATADEDGEIGLSPVFGIDVAAHPQNPILFLIGSDDTQVVYSAIVVDGGLVTGGPITAVPVEATAGVIVTFASFPYVNKDGDQVRVTLVSIGSRSFQFPNSNSGLFVIQYDPSDGSYTWGPISDYDALGTGTNGEFPSGINARQLAPRGVVAYNNHCFAWGFDSRDSVGDGPNRVMFSNIGNPLKWGNDPEADAIADGGPETDRAFEDSDAIELGGSGEAIRCGYVWRGKLWFGTNRELHYVEGFGRESFKTNGALPLARSRNVIGPKAMMEGPDGLLYGVSDEGLWRCDGAAVDGVGDKLRDFDGASLGWWDLIWSDASRTLLDYPGRTNQDLVWMLSLSALNQVWIGIPHCNAAAGSGYGTDTVIIKYHTMTGGFTRQVFTGKLLTAAAQLTREAVAAEQTYLCDSADDDNNVLRYGYRATQTSSPVMPTVLPDFTLGPYAPFGPDGVGVMRRKYLTLSWTSTALPLAFILSLTVDGQESAPVTPLTLTIGPVAPSTPTTGDVWVDTSGSDANLGNTTAGSLIAASAGDYIIRRYVASWARWVHVAGGGQQGTRVTVPLAFAPIRGSRFSLRVRCTAAGARFQIEQFGDRPSLIREAV